MDSKTYWAKREAEALKHYITEEAEYDKQINKIYSNMLANCQKEINAFYGRYADKEGITIAEAKKRVSSMDIKAYEAKAEKYVKDKTFSKQANEEMRLYNATMRINRLEMLKANIGLELIAGSDDLEKFMEGVLKGRTEAELARQAGILGKTIKNNAEAVHSIVNASFHNATFSDRIWNNSAAMKADLDKLIQSGLIAGKNANVLAKDLQRYFIGEPRLKNGKKGAKYRAEVLMRTELARVQTEAQKQSFIRNGFTQYQFITNGNCCDICADIKDKVFDVDKMMPGENAPPMHPLCRCSTAAYSDRREYEAWLDYLENGGTTADWEAKGKAEWEKAQGKGTSKKIFVFTPAKTIEEAEEYIKQYVDEKGFGALGVSYKGISVESANAVNKTLGRLYETFDLEKLGGVYAAKGNTKLGKMIEGATAAYSPIRKSLLLNSKSLKKLDDIAKSHAEEIRLIDMYAKDPKSLVFKSTRAETVTKASILSGRGTIADCIEDVVHHEMGHAMERTLAKMDGYDKVKANMPKYAENISGYATINENEYIAESFTSYMKGEKVADPALVELFERMKK